MNWFKLFSPRVKRLAFTLFVAFLTYHFVQDTKIATSSDICKIKNYDITAVKAQQFPQKKTGKENEKNVFYIFSLDCHVCRESVLKIIKNLESGEKEKNTSSAVNIAPSISTGLVLRFLPNTQVSLYFFSLLFAKQRSNDEMFYILKVLIENYSLIWGSTNPVQTAFDIFKINDKLSKKYSVSQDFYSYVHDTVTAQKGAELTKNSIQSGVKFIPAIFLHSEGKCKKINPSEFNKIFHITAQ